MWPSGVTPTSGPTLLTGVKMSDSDHLIDHLMEWERKFESADLEKHKQFLRDRQLSARDHPLAAVAWENGYVPEADPSRGIILDFQEKCDGKMPSTVILHSNSIAVSLEDHMQVQCLPVFGSDRPRWTYRKLPKVTEFRSLIGFPFGAGDRRR